MRRLERVPLLWDRARDFRERVEGRTPVVFLDYDGTLTPIVEDYSKAFLADSRETAAQYALADCDCVQRFLELLIAFEPESPS